MTARYVCLLLEADEVPDAFQMGTSMFILALISTITDAPTGHLGRLVGRS